MEGEYAETGILETLPVEDADGARPGGDVPVQVRVERDGRRSVHLPLRLRLHAGGQEEQGNNLDGPQGRL